MREEINFSGGLRSCSDCDIYRVEALMITKADGRVICPACQKAIEAQARERLKAYVNAGKVEPGRLGVK